MPDFQQESVWFITFVGLILSDVTCCLILYIYWKNKHINQLPLKIIAMVNFYGLSYSIVWTINLIMALFLLAEIPVVANNVGPFDITCYILTPLKIFCNLQWFQWNGLLLALLHSNLKGEEMYERRLDYGIFRIFNPISILFSIIITLVPLYNTDVYISREFSPQYVCLFHPKHDDIASKVLYVCIFILPMWMIVLYTIYIYIDLCIRFRRVKRKLPGNYFKLMYQPLIIVLTWIWPNLSIIDHFLSKNLYQIFIDAFIISQGYTICLQSLLFLRQIQQLHPIQVQIEEERRNDSLSLMRSIQSTHSSSQF